MYLPLQACLSSPVCWEAHRRCFLLCHCSILSRPTVTGRLSVLVIAYLPTLFACCTGARCRNIFLFWCCVNCCYCVISLGCMPVCCVMLQKVHACFPVWLVVLNACFFVPELGCSMLDVCVCIYTVCVTLLQALYYMIDQTRGVNLE